MADSVGKIQLDIEISPNSIVREMGSLNKAFSSGMKSTFNRMNGFIKNSVARLAGSFRSMVTEEANEVKEVPAKLAEQIEALAAQMDNATNLAEMYRQRLKELVRTYEMLDAASKKGAYGEKLREEMLKTEERMLRYGARSDKLRLEIEKLEAATAQAGQATEKTGRQIDAASKQAGKAEKRFGGFATTIQRAFTRVLRQVFIFTVLYKVIRGLMDYIGSALKTNEAFSNSLAQVKTNLQVAFMPIYQAVLPALQTLMRWLATATTYIAAFISALFGKSYKQSFAAAQGLNAAKKSMEGYGKAAKKTLGALAGFDEINLLQEPEEAGGGAGAAGPDLVAPPVDTTAFEASVAGFRERVLKLFQSLKTWWKTDGVVMFAPFREGWQKLLTDTLIPAKNFFLYDFFEPITKAAGNNLAPIFADVIPWAIGETGKWWLWLADVANKIWTDIIEPVYTLIRDIVVDTLGIINELWEEHGQGLLDGLSEFFQNVRDLWDKLWTEILEPIIIPFWEMLQDLWDEHLKDLVKQVGDFVMKLIKGALDLYNGFIAPIVKWLIDFMAPKVKFAFEFIRDVIKTVVGTISDILKGVIKILGGIIDFIVGIFTGDWKRAWDGIKNIVTGIWDVIVGAIKGAINLVIDAINMFIRGLNKIRIDIPDWLAGLVGKKGGKVSFNIPLIPKLARGGIIDQPTLAMIGERGKEAVLPLEQNTGWMDALANNIASAVGSAVLQAMQFAGGGSSQGSDRELVIEMDGIKVARVLLPKLDREAQRMGMAILKPV